MEASKSVAVELPGTMRPLGCTLDTVRIWRRLAAHLARVRCRWMHRSISRPVRGRYICWTCLREYDVNW